MVERPDPPEHGDETAERSSVQRNAWQATLDDLDEMEMELADDGWETVAIVAGDTEPEHPDATESGRFGLTHVIPRNKVEEFTAAFEAGEFPTYDVYRSSVEGREFLVTALLDPDTRHAILIAATYARRAAEPLVEAAADAGEMYTHVQRLDGTHLGSFRHEEYEKFFPDAP